MVYLQRGGASSTAPLNLCLSHVVRIHDYQAHSLICNWIMIFYQCLGDFVCARIPEPQLTPGYLVTLYCSLSRALKDLYKGPIVLILSVGVGVVRCPVGKKAACG